MRTIEAQRRVKGKALRPRDAATLIVLRRRRSGHEVLMGRRSDAHAFMPGKIVFPGGAVDRGDGLAPSADELHPIVREKLLDTMKGRPSARRARAIALAGVRETFEETGLVIGREGSSARSVNGSWGAFARSGHLPTLSALRLIARAITPPGRVRRFDARFFAVYEEDVVHHVPHDGGELLETTWHSLDNTDDLDLPRITAQVLDDLRERLHRDDGLHPERPAPFYFMRQGTFRRDWL